MLIFVDDFAGIDIPNITDVVIQNKRNKQSNHPNIPETMNGLSYLAKYHSLLN